ncbi:MAG: hypothetical protein KBS81_00725, partial [Spirochaetales bacterium]|nr:hypothetical protein [Candidatus Physcosoma equi]
MEFIAGIDGGGTKTTLLIGKPDGSLVARHTLGAFNINSIGEAGFSHLLQEFMTIFKDYGRCLHLTIGAAGISNTTMQKLVHEAFDKEDIAFDLVGDHIIALEGAHGGDAGLAVIAGTGSICFGKGLDGTIERCG